MASEKPGTDAFAALSRHRTELMGLSALLILIFHCWIPLFPGHRIIGGIEAVVKRTGFLGVDAFFFLSGMGLVFAVEKETLPEFYRKRFSRLLPPYLLVGVLRAVTEHWTPADFLWKVSGAAFLFENIYAFLWFVPGIALLYFAFPLYARGMRRCGRPVLYTAACIALWFVLSILLFLGGRDNLWGFLDRIPIFMLGALTGWLGKEKRLWFSARHYGIMAALLALGVILLNRTLYHNLYLLVPISFAFLPAILIVVPSCFLLSAGMELLQRKSGLLCRISGGVLFCFRIMGMVSLELYCLQEWMWDKILIAFTGFSYTVIDPAIILIMTGLAWLMHFCLYYTIPKTVRYFNKNKKV